MISLCIICAPTDEEAKLLDRCLSYVSPFVGEICLTVTGQNKKCEEVGKKYKAKVSHFEWVNDFAKARNFNFAQATGEFVFWCDADDCVKGAEHLPKVIEKMKEGAIDCGVMFYLYDFNNGDCTVKHLKTRIVKNDGCVEWVGKVHEDFKNNREIESTFIKEIEILHLTSGERAKVNAKRNLEIAKQSLVDEPSDARNYYLMGNAHWGLGNVEKAIEWFKKFVKVSGSDEEKYQAYMVLGEIAEDRDYFFKGMELRPIYPEAYFKLGASLGKDRRFEQALNFFEIGLQLPKPDMTKIVHNPRDYDYNPLMHMMDIYLETGEYQKAMKILDELKRLFPKDKEIVQKAKVFNDVFEITKKVEKATSDILQIKDKGKLKRYFDKMDADVRQHPKMCAAYNASFVKETSSGKDLVYYCSYTSKVWNPDIAMKDGIGGSEEAVINLSKGLAKDWNVTVYCNCGTAKVYDGVQYKPFWEWNPKDKQDATILWRHPKPVDIKINSDKIYLDLHDVLPKEEFTPERLAKIDKIFVKSQAHRKLFPNVPDEKIAIIPNGVSPELFEEKVEKNPYLILNTSSPDRHLDATLDIFEELIKRSDKPWKLAWYYGWEVFSGVQSENKEMMQWKDKMTERFNLLVAEGRAEGGFMINHKEIARKYLEAGVFCYPTEFMEIFCISSLKAQLAGCICITSDAGALGEVAQYGAKFHTDMKKWGVENTFGDTENKEKYLDALMNPPKVDIEKMKKWARDFGNWDGVVELWHKHLTNC